MPKVVDQSVIIKQVENVILKLNSEVLFSQDPKFGLIVALHDLKDFYLVEKSVAKNSFFGAVFGTVPEDRVIVHVDMKFASVDDDLPNLVEIHCFNKDKNQVFAQALAEQIEKLDIKTKLVLKADHYHYVDIM